LDSRVRHTINLKICIDLLIWSQEEDFQKMKQRIALANISVVIST